MIRIGDDCRVIGERLQCTLVTSQHDEGFIWRFMHYRFIWWSEGDQY